MCDTCNNINKTAERKNTRIICNPLRTRCNDLSLPLSMCVCGCVCVYVCACSWLHASKSLWYITNNCSGINESNKAQITLNRLREEERVRGSEKFNYV